MNNISKLAQICREHPQSVGQTYWQHFRFSAGMSFRLLRAAASAFTHGLIPGVCQTSTSRAINDMHQKIHQQTDRANLS